MKISKLIEELKRHQDFYGDIEVLAKNECGTITIFDYEDLYLNSEDGDITLEIDA